MRIASPPRDLAGLLFDLEGPIRDVQYFGGLLRHIGAQNEGPPPTCLYVLGTSLDRLGDELEQAWTEIQEEERRVRAAACA